MQLRAVQFWITWAWKYICNFKVQVVIWEILRACYYSAWVETRRKKKINKNLRQQEVFLYAAHPFPLRIIKDGQIFYNSGTCKKRFVHETRCRPPMISDNTLRLCHAHSSTDGLEVTAIYTGKYLELNALRLGLKNISISNKLDNGQEEKIIFLPLFGMACTFTLYFSFSYKII